MIKYNVDMCRYVPCNLRKFALRLSPVEDVKQVLLLSTGAASVCVCVCVSHC